MDPEVAGKLRDLVDRINQLGLNPNKVRDVNALNVTYERIRSKVMKFQEDSKNRFDGFKRDILGEIDGLNREVDRKNNVAS